VTQTQSTGQRTDLTTALAPSLLEELEWRGMLQDQTPGLAERLASGRPITAYNGFDPTADSLHVGHMVPIFGLLHLQRHGNRPIALVGGGTGMIGDPSFRSADRVLMTRETVVHNVAGIRRQLERFLDFNSGPTGALLMDNYDWLGQFALIDFLRDIGKYFTIPYMLDKDSVQQRLAVGLTFTEFSYMLLQSADFLHLYRDEGVEMQTGGADQWGNITAGLELIRRSEDGAVAHGLSFPLLLNASGAKFGKSQGDGNVWLDPARTSPFEFYQYWFDVADLDVGRQLRTFTLFDQASIERLEAEQSAHPEQRPAQRALAFDITARVHGVAAADAAVAESQARFGGGELPESAYGDFEVGPEALASAVDLAVATGAATSRGEARRLIEQGGLSVNDERITDPSAAVERGANGTLRIRVGRKRVFLGRVRDG
jgi:tyrosyl-tRNA synthetase